MSDARTVIVAEAPPTDDATAEAFDRAGVGRDRVTFVDLGAPDLASALREPAPTAIVVVGMANEGRVNRAVREAGHGNIPTLVVPSPRLTRRYVEELSLALIHFSGRGLL